MKLTYLAVAIPMCALTLVASCKKETKPDEPLVEEVAEVNAHEYIWLSGTVDKYPVAMVLECKGDTITGYNYYIQKGRKASTDLQLKGTLREDGILELFEWVKSNDYHSSHFLGAFSAEEGFQGKFDRPDGKEMNFSFRIDSLKRDEAANTPLGFSRTKPANFASLVGQLRSAPVNHTWFDEAMGNVVVDDEMIGDELPDDGEEFVANDSEESADISGDGSIDEYLDSYERVLNKYVSWMKKVDRDDPTALVTATSLYKELLSLSEKADKYKGRMSQAQMSRFMRIQQAFNKAIAQYGN